MRGGGGAAIRGGGAAILGGGDGAAILGGGGGGAPSAAVGCRSDAGCRRRRPCHVHRRRRRGSPQFRLQLRFRSNRSGGLWRRGGAGWRGYDPRRAGDAWSRLANGRCGSRRPDGGPGTGSRAGSGRSRCPGGAAPRPRVRIDGPWRYRSARRRGWRAPGTRNRQGVGPRQRLGRRQRARRIGRQRRVAAFRPGPPERRANQPSRQD